ncbi:Membrane-bound lytic murein transglycosylase F [Pseudomonas fluorescens]|nr:transporter substrate-binding domain-containing protein [Pseudomonas fluorescens]CAG8869854.1 Membrane-bound lytic murein transglycosylase F [Pseudomonas fluorescens]VVP98003.1 Membrane-bound lytic murein transglycosylase F [Pseudomonas fluorescens]
MKRVCRLWVIGWLWLPLMAWAAPPAPSSVALEPAQQQWLDAHRSLRVGLVLQAPYAQFDRRLQQLYGVNVELVNWLGRSLGLDLTWRNFPDQAALEHALQAGEVDLAPGLTQTPRSLRLWLFSDPYMRVPQRVVGPRNGAVAVDLETLTETQRVAVRMPSALADYLLANYPALNLQGVPEERQALQLVLSDQASFAVIDEAQLSRLARENEFTELVVVGDIGLPQLLRVGSRRDWPMLSDIIQRGLQAIPAKDLEQLHQRWLQPTYPRLNDSTGLWRNFAIVLALLLLCALATLAWQRRQQHRLERSLLAAREALNERQSREGALRLSQFSIDQSAVGILWVNWDSHVRYANHAAERMLGYPEGQLLDRPFIDFEPNLHMDRWLEVWNRARAAGGEAEHFETYCLRTDGALLPVDLSLSFLRFRDAEYLVVFLTDITERRRALAAQRELSAHLESVREEEKARIAREVHDELGQVLTVLKLEVSMCELAYAELDPGLNERLSSMKRLIAQLFQQVRDVASALRPPILDAGIASAIEWQARRFEARTQIPCLVRVPDTLPALSDAKATGLFRILQEALTNVMRHAQAHTVQIELVLQGAGLQLTVIDDGLGFNMQQTRPTSFGLVGLRERVLMLGGSLTLDSEPGEGTSLSVAIPLDHGMELGVRT